LFWPYNNAQRRRLTRSVDAVLADQQQNDQVADTAADLYGSEG
jgi:hypothetical protein